MITYGLLDKKIEISEEDKKAIELNIALLKLNTGAIYIDTDSLKTKENNNAQ